MSSAIIEHLDNRQLCINEETPPESEGRISSWVRSRFQPILAPISAFIAAGSATYLTSDTMGGKSARLDVVNIVSRVERSAYNLVRLCSLWHHALNNENIILD